jgi:transcriptional regulator with XRE-family HTH domain
MDSIRNVIKSKGFTLEQVASLMENKNGGKGITQSALTQMLNGNPSISRVKEIAKIVGVSVSELVGEEKPYPILEEENHSWVVKEEAPLIESRRVKCPYCQKDLIITIEEAAYKK